MARLDHCFLFASGLGERGMAFCRGVELDIEAARQRVREVLARSGGAVDELAYLGRLDYDEMDHAAGSLLEPFEKFDPVWLVYFRWREGT